jgi:hypothetical protein
MIQTHQAQICTHPERSQTATKANFAGALDYFVDESIASSPPLLDGQMAQLAAAHRLTINDVAGVRLGANCRLQTDENSASLDCFGRKITLPLHVAGAVRFALNHPRFVIRDLPGGLDDSGKLTLVRRLIREGLVVALLP